MLHQRLGSKIFKVLFRWFVIVFVPVQIGALADQGVDTWKRCEERFKIRSSCGTEISRVEDGFAAGADEKHV